MLNTPEEIIDEMRRKPDAQILLEWIERHLGTADAGMPTEEASGDVLAAIAAYCEALEG